MEDLSGQVCVVTGAAGGLGSAMTLALAEGGATVYAVDRAPSLYVSLDERARERGVTARIVHLVADLGDRTACERVVPQVLERSGRLDALVNNAGLGMTVIDPDYAAKPPRFWEAGVGAWQAILDVNVRAGFILARAAMPAFLARGRGRIVNVTTSFDTMTSARVWAYGQSKAALEAASASWAAQVDGRAITVNILVPGGPADTGLIPASAGLDRAKLIRPDVMGRPMRWLASSDADGFNGRRIIAIKWDAALAPRAAAEAAATPAGWAGFGAQAVYPK